MNDQYRITEPPPRQGMGHFTIMTIALWIGLVVGVILNTGLQAVGLHFVAVPFGAVALICGIALIVRAVKSRRSR
ncbi:hypothetical protein O1R50_20170 [Glycomyces luteolus]|uniref:DUF2530 domain-containing protein n=1 Tax=Glycomyces luteolus TaxID=2670330 RepID=A0A9X3PN75_9ACTN|nr:hypothetical protein [Glycomyces luteolus]MDA1361955.1 hypothetical protein [Glycomyces luteolus]